MSRELRIEFLFLDLETCVRCRATDATLLAAIERTRQRWIPSAWR
jgi:hypothetical protein